MPQVFILSFETVLRTLVSVFVSGNGGGGGE
jgi:hypothetical protein